MIGTILIVVEWFDKGRLPNVHTWDASRTNGQLEPLFGARGLGRANHHFFRRGKQSCCNLLSPAW
jgi:hypothetical protein